MPEKLLKQRRKVCPGLTAWAGAGLVPSRNVASRLVPSNSLLLLVWIGLVTCRAQCDSLKRTCLQRSRASLLEAMHLWQAPARVLLLLLLSFCSAGAL